MLKKNLESAIDVGKILYSNYYLNDFGIFGIKDMPESDPPIGIDRGSLEHQLFITLIVAIDYLRDAHLLWENARKAYINPNYNYIFNLEELIEVDTLKLEQDLRSAGLSLRFYKNDAQIMKKVALGLKKFFNGSPENLLKQVNHDGKKALQTIRQKQISPYFPYLKGPKIGPLWLRMLKDVCNLQINLISVPIAVDIHIARATFTSGAIKGRFSGTINDVRREIEKIWFEVAEFLREKEKRNIYALSFDEPLWTLSKFGCKYRQGYNKENCKKYKICPIKNYCVNGLIQITQKKNGLIVNSI
ncbi:MAG: hypothetical protein ACTSRP_11505 [Candidatus Helarchaeota archaeon]